MQEQNFRNHSRLIPLWHYIIPLVIAVILGMSIINLKHTDMQMHDLHMWLPIILIPLVMLFIWFYARAFALKAQDRAIRAEENFRYYILTGKSFPKELRMGQIIALRFASDEEFPGLVTRAISENLSSKQIKQEIKNWKADNYRV